jgi:hypothetical protein
MISVFERPKTVRALDGAAIGSITITIIIVITITIIIVISRRSIVPVFTM